LFAQQKPSFKLTNLKKNDTIFLNSKNYTTKNHHKTSTPLFIVDGKEVSKKEIYSLTPNVIKSVIVLKGEKAINKYGKKGTFGVIEIYLK